MDCEKEELQKQLNLYVKEHIRLSNLIFSLNEALCNQNYGIAKDLLATEFPFQSKN